MFLPSPIIGVLAPFRSAFSAPTWEKAQVLLVGTLLVRGRRTVAAALRQTGHAQDERFSAFHHVLNRARWSALELSRRLLRALVGAFLAPGEVVTVVMDETLERRWGRQITKRGHYRDPLLSSKGLAVSNSGLRWILCAVVVRVPWTDRPWALPFLSILASPPAVDAARQRRHKTIGDWAQQVAALLRRWLPDRRLHLLGDSTYSSIELGLACAGHRITLIAPLRLDANLFEPAPPRRPGQWGRPRVKGGALPKLSAVLADPLTEWETVRLRWYAGPERPLELVSGTAVWYRSGLPPLPIRWVLTRDPAGQREPRSYFSTDPDQPALAILREYMKRWPLEVTIEESRAHLGIETQRQWSDPAIERTTPCLFGLFSLVALFAHALHPDGRIPVASAAWYDKQVATFSDVLAEVRRHLWRAPTFRTSPADPDLRLVPRAELDRLLLAACA
jgi:DDE superfamily endonuclease